MLAACVPGAFGGWLLLLEQFGTWRLEDVLEFAIGYAEHGFPLVAGIRATIDRTEELLRELARLGATSTCRRRRSARSSATRPSRRRTGASSTSRAAARASRRSRRPAARTTRASSPRRSTASPPPRAACSPARTWRAGARRSSRSPSSSTGGLTVCKTLPWAAGPVGLQQLALLDGFDLAELSPAEFVHVVTECAKLAFADRDALYGDGEVPLETLLSKAYNDERRALVGEDASEEYRPGIGRLPHLVEAAVTPGAGEPTRGDTVHLDVVDRHGNMFSATPSGGWLQSSPVIPALGWPLGTRAQMFWLEEGLASSLRPGARPRTTLCPGLALRDGKPYLAWGTPGGDQQEQWALHVFVRHVDLGLNLQEAIDAPEFHMDHLISSFYPRGFARRSVTVEERFGDDVVDDLRRRGHDVEVSGPWTLGRVTAVAREDGRPAQGRREPARHAGLRRRPLTAAVRRRRDPRRVESVRHLRLLLRRTPPRAHHVLRRRILEALALVAIVDAVGTVLMWLFERDAGRGEIHNLWDAFFFTTVQLLTVSSQMPNPVTTAGRIVDIVLELTALFLVSAIAGVFASFFLNVGKESRGRLGGLSRRAASVRTACMSRASTCSPHSGQARWGITVAPQFLCVSVIAWPSRWRAPQSISESSTG